MADKRQLQPPVAILALLIGSVVVFPELIPSLQSAFDSGLVSQFIFVCAIAGPIIALIEVINDE